MVVHGYNLYHLGDKIKRWEVQLHRELKSILGYRTDGHTHTHTDTRTHVNLKYKGIGKDHSSQSARLPVFLIQVLSKTFFK